jgi:hypothetical protein
MICALRAIRGRRISSLCLLSAFALLSCASPEWGATEGIKVIDSPVVSYPLAWMDNERILMIERTGKIVARPNGGGRIQYRLISYNYKTTERQDYGSVGGRPCYADGYISYYLEDDTDNKHVIAVYGPLGNETRRRVEKGEIWFEEGARGSCRPWSELPKRPSWANEKTTIWFLWPRFGLIDCRTQLVSPLAKNVKARFYRSSEGDGIELPFSCYEVSGYGTLQYHPFKKAYFAFEFDFRNPWPKGRNRRGFWLFPDGHVETLTFPYSQAIRYSAVPVADGILAFSHPADRKDDYWVYFLTPQSSKRLFRGSAKGITSPDGCKVAMLIDPDFKAKVSSRDVKTPVELKILDFCSGK